MTWDRVAVVEATWTSTSTEAVAPNALIGRTDPLRAGSGLTARKAIELFEDQVLSRQLDVAARELKKTNRSFYTIGRRPRAERGRRRPARLDDPAFLHYRSGGLMMSRARRLAGSTPAL